MEHKISARRVILTSFFVDSLDIVVNLIVVLLTGSVVIVSELVQGISDMAASGLLLIGLKRSRTERFFWALISALVMLLVAASLSFYFGLRRFLNPEPIDNIYVAYAALIIGAISNTYAFVLSAKRIRQHKGSSLIMTKNTFVLDLMGASAAVMGLIALIFYEVFGEIRFDGVGAMGIGIVLAFLSLRLIFGIKRMRKKRGEYLKL